MEDFIAGLRKDEQTKLKLRKLYEQFGYQKVSLNKFEDYSLYVENKDFLKTDKIISFLNTDGKLSALKPDVTLSIIKNIRSFGDAFQRLYYTEPVYRISKSDGLFREFNQIGLELIGESDLYSSFEAITLALESLKTVDEHYSLELSHLGFISGLLEEIDFSARQTLLECLYAKNIHDLSRSLKSLDISKDYRKKIETLPSLYGNMEDVLEKSRGIVLNDRMKEALEELYLLWGLLKDNGYAKHVKLDFSVVNNLDYYNGLIFHGYLEGIPGAVLTGGRYDNYLKKNWEQRAENREKACKKGAIGFALSLDELNFYFREKDNCDDGIALSYNDNTDLRELMREAESLRRQGKKVTVSKELLAKRGGLC